MKKNLRTDFTGRQFMLSKDFEIYYYNDRHMRHVGDHTHDYYEFYFFLSGEVSIEIGGVSHTLQQGDMILVPPGVPHHVDILNPELSYRRFVFWISQEYGRHLMAQSPEYGYLMQLSSAKGEYLFHFDVFRLNAIQSKIFGLIEELHSERYGRTAKLSLCVMDLLFFLNRSVYEERHPKSAKEEQSLYQNLLTYIEDHLEEELSLDTLAAQFFVSKYHIAHIFKEQLGISVHRYILKKRLALCRDAMLRSANIGEACLLCGFQDYSSFYRAFRKEYGMSPKEYQETAQLSACEYYDPSE